MKKIVVFASGSGTNAENIIKYFAKSDMAKVVCVFSNSASAFVLDRAKNNNVAFEVFSKESLNNGKVLHLINDIHPDLIVLAGFLLKFPEDIILNYPNKIINIHPALLPKYGGKGMYGMHIHTAVVENKEKETGITVHYVNENYDEGGVLFQEKVILSEKDTAEDVAKKIHFLEQLYFPEIIANVLREQL
jgi:phosphoribosylglycinamide formyltransferase-1